MSALETILLDAASKSVLVLAVALPRRSSAAARHLVWFLAVAALPLLPVLSWTLPGWHVLPGWLETRQQPGAIQPPPEQLVAAFQALNAPEPPTIPPESTPLASEPVAPVEAHKVQPAPMSEPSQRVAKRLASPVNYWRWTLAAWLVVAWLALMPVVLGMMSLWRLERGARRENEPGWLQLLQRLVERLGIRRRVALLKSGRRRMPMTWGIIRPRLLLPEESREWPEERRRVVLLHELAHAKRLDYLTNLVTQLACALYWFNPLVWLAARRMAGERERACDDIVLNHGAQPADYAEQVLQIAAGLPVGRFAAHGGIPMARPSGLEGRLRAILDGTRNRAALSRVLLLATVAAFVLVVVPVAMLKAASADITAKVEVFSPATNSAPAAASPAASNAVSSGTMPGLVYRDPWGYPYIVTVDTKDGPAPITPMMAQGQTASGALTPGNDANATDRLEFLPEIERVLDGRGALGARVYLSFGLGTVTMEQNLENVQRNRSLHEDLKYDPAPASEEIWNATPEQVIAALSDNLAPPLPTMQVIPGVWFFRTRDGTYGLMRVIGFVDKQPGVKAMKLVYKLARPVRSPKQARLRPPITEQIKQFLAGEPAATGYALEIWEQDPAGRMQLRKDLADTPIYGEHDSRRTAPIGHIYYLKSANRFYIQWEGDLSAGPLHYYGPFAGDPAKVFGWPATNGPRSDWVDAVDGVSFGLAAKKTVWASGETPELVARVRNQGTQTSPAQYDQGWAQLEMDGVWYNHNFFWDVTDESLRAGQEIDDIPVMVGTTWYKVPTTNATGREQIQLTPGKHTLRVQYNWGMVGQPRLHAFSNPVEIEIAGPVVAPGARATNAGASLRDGQSGWGETKGGLRPRLVAETNVFQAGQPILMQVEIENLGDGTKYFHYPSAPFFDDLEVADTKGRRVPFIGGPIQLQSSETNLGYGGSAAFNDFDLARAYYLRVPGRYTVRWRRQEGWSQSPTGPPHALTEVPPSGDFQFEVTAAAGYADDGDPVGRLLPLMGRRWLGDATNFTSVAATNQAEPWGPIWLGGSHYQKSASVRPGGNWQAEPGYGFSIYFDHQSFRNYTSQIDNNVILLWLTDEPAAEQRPARTDPPPSEYLGKISRWYVYLSADVNALKAWPTVRNDIKRALGGRTDGAAAGGSSPSAGGE